MNNKGLTLIELIALLVILGIIATISIFTIGNTINDAKIEVDSYNLITLNAVTSKYATSLDGSVEDIFEGLDTDSERMQVLIESGYLSAVVETQQNNAAFVWEIDTQEWMIQGGNVEVIIPHNVNYNFSEDTIEVLLEDGAYGSSETAWDSVGDTLQTDNYTELFVPINKVEYTIVVEAQIDEGTRGGYGIFFDSTLRNNNPDKDDGYVFQFDRGYGSGSLIVRPRTNGKEGNPIWQLRSESTDLIPTKVENPDWWSARHIIKITVELIDETSKLAVFYIDNIEVGSLAFNVTESGETNYTGFRVWSATASFYSLIIE